MVLVLVLSSHLKVRLKLGNVLSDSELHVFVGIKQTVTDTSLHVSTTTRLFLCRYAYLLVAFVKGWIHQWFVMQTIC